MAWSSQTGLVISAVSCGLRLLWTVVSVCILDFHVLREMVRAFHFWNQILNCTLIGTIWTWRAYNRLWWTESIPWAFIDGFSLALHFASVSTVDAMAIGWHQKLAILLGSSVG